ncbi:hypothetical protein CSUI_006536, partial [Cystoisospora suis]
SLFFSSCLCSVLLHLLSYVSECRRLHLFLLHHEQPHHLLCIDGQRLFC